MAESPDQQKLLPFEPFFPSSYTAYVVITSYRQPGETVDWVRLRDLGMRSLGMPLEMFQYGDVYDSVMDSPGWCLSELERRSLFDMDKWHLVRVGMKWYLVTNIVLVALAWLESITSN